MTVTGKVEGTVLAHLDWSVTSKLSVLLPAVYQITVIELVFCPLVIVAKPGVTLHAYVNKPVTVV